MVNLNDSNDRAIRTMHDPAQSKIPRSCKSNDRAIRTTYEEPLEDPPKSPRGAPKEPPSAPEKPRGAPDSNDPIRTIEHFERSCNSNDVHVEI